MQFFNDEWELFVLHCGFTDDEMSVVNLLRRGWYSVDIAEELSVSVSTVKRRRNSIKKKISRYLIKQG